GAGGGDAGKLRAPPTETKHPISAPPAIPLPSVVMPVARPAVVSGRGNPNRRGGALLYQQYATDGVAFQSVAGLLCDQRNGETRAVVRSGRRAGLLPGAGEGVPARCS